MENKGNFARPPFSDALRAWRELLGQRGLPTECLWLYEENLCFEKDDSRPGGLRLGFQTAFTPAPPEAERVTFGYFSAFNARLVFYRLGSAGEKSLCAMLCDPWFEKKGEQDGFVRRDEWLMSFCPGGAETIEEIRDEQRWQKRILRGRPLHDLDFCMTLRAVHEKLAHGRVLSTYERSALNVMHLWHRMFSPPR